MLRVLAPSNPVLSPQIPDFPSLQGFELSSAGQQGVKGFCHPHRQLLTLERASSRNFDSSGLSKSLLELIFVSVVLEDSSMLRAPPSSRNKSVRLHSLRSSRQCESTQLLQLSPRLGDKPHNYLIEASWQGPFPPPPLSPHNSTVRGPPLAGKGRAYRKPGDRGLGEVGDSLNYRISLLHWRHDTLRLALEGHEEKKVIGRGSATEQREHSVPPDDIEHEA